MAYFDEVMADSPIIYWTLDDASWPPQDSSGNGNHADTLVSGSLGADPIIATGSAMHCDGANDAVRIVDTPAALLLSAGATQTVELWMRSTQSAIGQLALTDGGSSLDLLINADTPGKVRARWGGSQYIESSITVTDGQAHHIVVTIDTTTVTLYVDGVSQGSAARVGTGNSVPDLYHGATSSLTRDYLGDLDEIAWYTTALSAARVAAHYTAGLPGPTLPEVVADFSGTGALSAVTSAVHTRTAAFSGTGTLSASVQAVGQPVAVDAPFSGSGTLSAAVEVAEPLPAVTAAFSGSGALSATVDVVEPLPTVEVVASNWGSGNLTANIEVDVPPPAPRPTQRNRVGGRRRSGIGIVSYDPPVVAPPATATPPQVKAVAQAHGPVTMRGTQPVYDVTRAEVDRDRDRIVVGGKDVTWFRGAPTPTPDYSLIEPLMYGSGRLELPQIAATFERPGQGALRWLRKGAEVRVQRVRDGAVVATDYKGVVVDWTISGGGLSVQLGGEASGRAALLDKQPALFPRRMDIGKRAFFTITNRLGLRFKPYLGPTTGILSYPQGGMSELDYLSQLVATATKRNGEQWTIMPGSKGNYRMKLKDRTTIHATAYFDDAHLSPDLRSDVAEEPNRIYATAVAPSGQKIKNGRYPGLIQGKRPPYPFNDTSRVWGEGTTDADTDSGAGVRALVWRLRTVGHLPHADVPGGYDADVTEAVRDLQEEAGLAETGNVNLATWRALFDLDVTGYTLNGSKIFPMAQRNGVRKWAHTPTGSVIGRNPGYKPHMLQVDQTIDMGAGFTRQRTKRFAKSELAHAATDNWVGTVTLSSDGQGGGTMALVQGKHTPGAGLTAADVMQPREIRPGMNVWAPQFMGGTLFHVSGVEVSDSGASVRLALDTRARDTMKAWEVIARNRETRRHPARAWMDDYRSSRMQKDSLITWDEVGGVLDDDVELTAGAWTVFPVVAGQEGTVARLRVFLDQPTDFAVAVFGKHIRAERLDNMIPNPLAKNRNDKDGAGVPWYEQRKIRNQLEKRFLLYAAGTHDQPCGIGRARKIDGNGNATGAQLTGKFWDDASFSYRTFAEPVLYVAVWTSLAANVEPGRMFWPQLEEGS